MTALEPFISKFVFTIIKSIQDKNLSYEKKYVIHSDLVPRVSEKVMLASLSEKVRPKTMQQFRLPTIPQRVMPETVSPPIQKTIPPGISHVEQGGLLKGYGKITPLLNDPLVSTIECQGAGKPIMVIRSGQRQITKIILSATDIKEILQKISEKTHIPILEGVFRSSVDNFSISVVVSEIIGSRFIIKKHTAYSMLER